MKNDKNTTFLLIKAVGQNDAHEVQRLVAQLDTTEHCATALYTAAEIGALECLKVLTPHCDPVIHAHATSLAVCHNHVACVAFLLSVVQLSDCSRLLRVAAEVGNPEMVALLLPHFDPMADDSAALSAAARANAVACVRLLTPLSNPKDNRSLALCWAINHENMECIEALLPVSDPKVHSNWPLRVAVGLRFIAGVDVLLPVSNIEEAKNFIRAEEAEGYEQSLEIIEQRQAFLQKQVLERHIPSPLTAKARKI